MTAPGGTGTLPRMALEKQFGYNCGNPAGTASRTGWERKPKKQTRRESPRAVVTNRVEGCNSETYANV
jgi:hypothetical protein